VLWNGRLTSSMLCAVVILASWSPIATRAQDAAETTSGAASSAAPADEPAAANQAPALPDDAPEPVHQPEASAAPMPADDAHADDAHADGHHDDAHGAGHAEGHADGHGDHGPKLGSLLPMWTVAPFVLLLLAIAVFPLVNPHWWEHNSNKGMIAAILAIPTALYLFSFGPSGVHALEHAGMEYVSFLLLLGALFAISGGIYIRGAFRGSPIVNTAFLLIGTVVASFVGTTGASMLLIRPLLRANETRPRVAHVVVFFIFTVSNCGGLLTPLGDPPLFIGFLKGVPFEWTLRLVPQWLLVNLLLLAVFFVWDLLVFRADRAKADLEPPLTAESQVSFGIEGKHNFLFLGAIIAIVVAMGQNLGGLGAPGEPWPWGVAELAMLMVAAASYFTTSTALRTKNRFTFGPIIEVAVLFAGIFTTMIPALALLNVYGKDMGLETEWQFFWATGVLSSFLDNAPTYLAFAVTACGIAGVPDEGRYLLTYLTQGGAQAAATLAAISCGAVFMGANTYIGNGPNFMVKAIAEENNIRMPGFFGYMAYSCGVLIPIFVLVTFVFFV
jgi:Na+/H+ antiporter NhaD/arsenite permease-like protein